MTASPFVVRPECPEDVDEVRRVNTSAFETAAEADLVDALRDLARPLVSLVADHGSWLSGHILFSPVTLPSYPDLLIMGLAPMAVRPARQRQGIGSGLVRAGLDACRALGAGAVVVVGHADYYLRFGFTPASRFGLACEYDVPDEVFMAIELDAGFLKEKGGTIRYHPAFAAV